MNESKTWQIDSQLNGFESYTIHLPDDYEGKVVCTLIRKKQQSFGRPAALHIHGFNDYFFHKHIADAFEGAGIDLYGLDLRKSGRSILPHQKMNNLRNIEEYFADIEQAIRIIRNEGSKKLVIMGHSMGGLLVALFAARYSKTELFEGIFLNSPFLEQNKDIVTRKILIPVVARIGGKWPNLLVPGGFSKHYGPSLHNKFKGEWDYNLQWKPHVAPMLNAGWIRAIYLAQKHLTKGIEITEPLLLMYPEKSYNGLFWNDAFQISDAVVNVKHIQQRSHCIRANKEEYVIQNAKHDLFLSKSSARQEVLELLLDWFHRKITG